MITDRDVALIEIAGHTVDLMIAHDTPWRPPDPATSLNMSPRVRAPMAENQLRLGEIIAAWNHDCLFTDTSTTATGPPHPAPAPAGLRFR